MQTENRQSKAIMAERWICAFWAMGRPLFLLGSAPIYLVGLSVAWRDGAGISLPMALAGLALVWLIQLATHYNNEYRDVPTDMATEAPTRVSGGSRVLVRGLVPTGAARAAAVAAFALAVLVALTLVLILHTGYWVLLLAGAGLTLGWGYSEPPLKLDSRGLGEGDIVLLAGFLAPATAYYVQTARFNLDLFLASVPLALLTFAVTLATEIPDAEPDRATGKMTLVARMGRPKSVKLHAACWCAGCFSLTVVLVILWPLLGWLSALATVPAGIAGIVCARASVEGDTASMERTGLLYSLFLGAGAMALSAAFMFG